MEFQSEDEMRGWLDSQKGKPRKHCKTCGVTLPRTRDSDTCVNCSNVSQYTW